VTRDFTVKTGQNAADLAMQRGSRLFTDSASSYRALMGYRHEYVNHTKKEYARGEVHENRAECLFSLLKPYLRMFRGVSKFTLPGYVGFFQFLRNFYQLTAFEQAEMILYAALDPDIANKLTFKGGDQTAGFFI
jgi:transposase